MIKKIWNSRFLPYESLCYRHKILEALGSRPVLVYTMGKVGSSSVYHSLRNCNISLLVYHVHYLTDYCMERVSQVYSEKNVEYQEDISLNQFVRGSTQHHLTGSYILKNSVKKSNAKKWNIITLFRDPVATFMSHVFQSPEIHTPFLFDQKGDLDAKKVNKYIREHFREFNSDKDHLSNWIDTEFHAYTGIDLYSYPFNCDAGYTIIKSENYDVAMISLEKLNSIFALVIKELTGTSKEVNMMRRNVTEKKDVADLYNELKNSIVIPKKDLEKVYTTKFARHFFTPEFRTKMIAKWSNPR